MRFNSRAYDQAFPRKEEPEVIESVVETFKPTRPASESVEDANVEDVEDVEEEVDNGHGATSESDIE